MAAQMRALRKALNATSAPGTMAFALLADTGSLVIVGEKSTKIDIQVLV